MPEPAVNPRKPSLSEGDRATIRAALAKLRAEGGNLLLEMQCETALQEPRGEFPKQEATDEVP